MQSSATHVNGLLPMGTHALESTDLRVSARWIHESSVKQSVVVVAVVPCYNKIILKNFKMF